MAPHQSANSSANEFDIPIEEIIFSCGICQATVSEIYADKDKVHALSSSGDESAIVPKLWIADCSHVFCGKHLEGGGAPFHSKHEPPKAQCPVCMSEPKHGNEEKRSLYAIRGLGKGEYDEVVPDSYLRVPPVKLESNDPAMDAMRFQYSHLVRYAKDVTKSWKLAEKKRRTVEHTLSKERKQWRTQEAELNKRIADLEQKEAKLNGWEKRKAMIDHYMKMVTKMSEDIAVMRGQLLELGYQVPDSQYGFQGDDNIQKPISQATKQNASSATLAASSSSFKRKHPTVHGDYADEEATDEKENRGRLQRINSHELMPPPLHRGRLTQPPPVLNGQHSQARQHHPSQQPVQVYEDGHWHGTQPDVAMEDAYEAQPPIGVHRGVYHEHGALPLRATQAQGLPRRHERSAQAQGLRDGFDHRSLQLEAAQHGTHLSRSQHQPKDPMYDILQVEQDHFQPSEIHDSQVSHFNTTYPDSDRQIYHSSDAPPVPRSQTMATSSQVLGTPSLRRPLEPVAGPAASPFFANRAPFRTSGAAQRPAARRSTIQHLQNPPTRDGTFGRPVASTTRAPAEPSYQSQPMPPPSAFGSQIHSRSSLPRGQQRYGGPSQRGLVSNSQPHPRSEAVYQRQEMTTLQTPRQPVADSQHGRLTLPPSRSRLSLGASQDSRLSMIPGARGAAPSQNIHARQSFGTVNDHIGYGPSFSGGRRPVQRR
ncbi:hypothetical protein PRZ48_012782 [Zasmidium cellare]|uniref:RING-type domain-containing protein n=1 Tax=Zasmidium cellare TaxID=395010 RepID=A0ABR0E6U3_ZASCE|nr:hypothetical protein PRZ48_012782 [Zasmidium cellare]